MVNKIPITEDGLKKLKEELKKLKTTDRPKNIKAIEVARAHGDLSENAEYSAAKEKQSFINGRIRELEFKIANADIIKKDNKIKDKVVFGANVIIQNVDTGEELKYTLLGQEEADIEKGKISILSPLGKALLGQKEGSEITVQAPIGKKTYEILKIN